MSVENLINIVRLGRKLTPAQSRAITAQLERIPAMERTLAAKDRDFTQLSIAYTAAVQAGRAKGVQFTSDECGYVCDALEECERLKEAVAWMLECNDCPLKNKTEAQKWGFDALWESRRAARKAVEELL